MITTVTLNPCVDRTVLLRGLRVGGHNRVDDVVENTSGKGINVSLALRHLGVETACVGFDGAGDGGRVARLLKENGIPCALESVPGGLRVNIKLTDTLTGEMTEINERGSALPPGALEALMRNLGEMLAHTDILVADGSVPPGVPESVYGDMIAMAHAAGARAVLDAAGALLRAGMREKPWLVKPNRFEMESYYNETIDSEARALSLCRRMLDEGAGMVCLSLGKQGALLVSPRGAWRCPGSEIAVRGTQGAGDSMVAGLCAAAMRGADEPEMLLRGVAAAQASLLLPGTALCRRADYERMLPLLHVQRIA